MFPLWNPTRISASVNEHISWIQKLSEHRVLEHRVLEQPEFMLFTFGLRKKLHTLLLSKLFTPSISDQYIPLLQSINAQYHTHV
jgi:hypothetical protein